MCDSVVNQDVSYSKRPGLEYVSAWSFFFLLTLSATKRHYNVDFGVKKGTAMKKRYMCLLSLLWVADYAPLSAGRGDFDPSFGLEPTDPFDPDQLGDLPEEPYYDSPYDDQDGFDTTNSQPAPNAPVGQGDNGLSQEQIAQQEALRQIATSFNEVARTATNSVASAFRTIAQQNPSLPQDSTLHIAALESNAATLRTLMQREQTPETQEQIQKHLTSFEENANGLKEVRDEFEKAGNISGVQALDLILESAYRLSVQLEDYEKTYNSLTSAQPVKKALSDAQDLRNRLNTMSLKEDFNPNSEGVVILATKLSNALDTLSHQADAQFIKDNLPAIRTLGNSVFAVITRSVFTTKPLPSYLYTIQDHLITLDAEADAIEALYAEGDAQRTAIDTAARKWPRRGDTGSWVQRFWKNFIAYFSPRAREKGGSGLYRWAYQTVKGKMYTASVQQSMQRDAVRSVIELINNLVENTPTKDLTDEQVTSNFVMLLSAKMLLQGFSEKAEELTAFSQSGMKRDLQTIVRKTETAVDSAIESMKTSYPSVLLQTASKGGAQ